ncbi:hypothetical protein [Sphingobacterium deserti]|uniref:Lipoprotein n=1 Tax=Sphingobacterium deserti TaxID=1229276 RepID=A0A0B8T563_9SPHI|nr:hypothetical protein [Sphingobacterium deserti]KGE12594.1 hypothetical protein DI53_3634 [Sphingobacterium deserti]
MKKYVKIAAATAMVACVTLFLLSCEKNSVDPVSDSGPAQVFVKLTDVERDVENNLDSAVTGKQLSAANSTKSSSSKVKNIQQQTFSLPFSDDITVFGTLQEATDGASSASTDSVRLKQSSTNKAAVQRNPLTPGTRYIIAVYAASGQFVAQNTYISGRESETTAFVLDGGSTYTFIGLSYNSQSTVPTISYSNTGVGTLSTGSVTATTQDLMVFKKSVTLTGGSNVLDVVLKHVFAEVTTNLIIDTTIGGTITSISSADMRPTRTSATYALGTEAVTYAALSSTGQTVTFPTIPTGGTKRLSSSPTLLLSPDATNGVLTLRNLTINGTSKAEFLIPNLNVSPGKKYNLNLNFRVPCTQDVNSTVFEARDGNFKDFTAPGADYGFVMDLYNLDNSFNMTINNTRIASNEIQFQASVSGYPRNIQFADGALWGLNGVSEIYNMQGSESSPVIRITISSTGQVSLEGRKTTGGPLLPLVPISGGNLTFNNVTWNRTGSNSIRVTQVVTGATIIAGRGRGKKVISCTN